MADSGNTTKTNRRNNHVWISKVREYFLLFLAVMATVAAAGNTQWVRHDQLQGYFTESKLDDMDSQIFYLESKISEGEASKADVLFCDKLKRDRKRKLNDLIK